MWNLLIQDTENILCWAHQMFTFYFTMFFNCQIVAVDGSNASGNKFVATKIHDVSLITEILYIEENMSSMEHRIVLFVWKMAHVFQRKTMFWYPDEGNWRCREKTAVDIKYFGVKSDAFLHLEIMLVSLLVLCLNFFGKFSCQFRRPWKYLRNYWFSC